MKWDPVLKVVLFLNFAEIGWMPLVKIERYVILMDLDAVEQKCTRRTILRNFIVDRGHGDEEGVCTTRRIRK